MVDLGFLKFNHKLHPDHPLRGTLLQSLKQATSPRFTDTYSIIQGEIPEFDVIILDVSVTDPFLRGAFMAYHYSSFIIEQGEPNPTKESLAAAMLGLLFNTVDYVRMTLDKNEFVGFCLNAGFRPVFRIISQMDEILLVAEHEKTQRFLRKFGAGGRTFLENRGQHLVMLGPILLTLGNNIQVEGYPGWITRKVRDFMGTLELENYNIVWTEATYPTVRSMTMIGTYLSACFELRREIFRICWSVSSLQGRYANLFKDVISLLKGTGMTHIILIDEFLYTKHRELLSIRLLADNNKGMLAVWEFLASLQPHEVYYAMILFDKEQVACLHRDNFPLHTAAAVAAASFETPSMIRCRRAKSQVEIILENIVHTYLNKKLRGVPIPQQ